MAAILGAYGRETPFVTSWLASGLDDDMRQPMFDMASSRRPFALATIAEADGGPRPVGSQMVITESHAWGFLSGGCIEADVALHGRAVLAEGAPRCLVYGRGSPFIDMRLPCGGRLDVLVEQVPGDDEAVRKLRWLSEARQPAIWESNGRERRCRSQDEGGDALAEAIVRQIFLPRQRLAVVGSDPFALAIAALGSQLGWETMLVAPFGPEDPAPFGLKCDRRSALVALQDLAPDPWTAIAVATHDLEVDEEVLVPALRSRAAYVGVLGSRRRLPERVARLLDAGLTDTEIQRLKAPIGLPIRARSPMEVAIAVVGEIIASTPVPAAEPAGSNGSGDAGNS